MPTFQKVKIKDIATVIMGQSPASEFYNQSGEGLPFFQGVKDFGKKYPMETSWTTVAHKTAMEGDILFSVRAPVGELNIANKDCCIGRGIAAIRSKSNQADYLYFLLKFYIEKIKRFGNGSIYDAINKDTLEKIIVDIFSDPKTQTKIAGMLSAYDDLIENNEKRIKVLEQMAQLLYTEWFVKFEFPASLCHPEPHHRRHSKPIPCHPEAPAEGSQGYKSSGGKMINTHTEYGKIPEGWEVKRLGDKLNISKGKNITKSTIVDGTVPVVAGGLSPAYFHNKANAYNPVVTISASGANSGFVNLYQEDIWASDCSYIDNNATPFVYFYYLFLKNKQIEITKLQRGSAQPHVYPKDLMQLLTLDIPEKLMNAFESKAKNNFDMIKNFKKKNQVLSQARDLLIPQLVTGKRELK